jgi:hypothetical protein
MSPESRSSRGDQLAEVRRERVSRGDGALAHRRVRRQQKRVEPARDVEPPALEALVVLEGDAEHLADHDHRQRVRELLDQVHRALALHAGEEAVHDVLDVRPQPLHHPRRERLVHERAQARVVRRIAVEHGQRALRRDRHAQLRRDDLLDGFLGGAAVAQDRHHVLVPGQHPEAQGTQVNRVLAAETVVRRVGISDEDGIHGIE